VEVDQADLAALLPHLVTAAELEALQGAPGGRFDGLLARAQGGAPVKPELWIPGPTAVRAEILSAMAEPMIGHRSADMRGLIHALDPYLETLFGASAPSHRVAVHSCTATGLMEMALRAVGPRVLCVVNGAFSKRFATIAGALGKEVVTIESPAGTPPDLEEAGRQLAASSFDAITVCLSETSTGVAVRPCEVARALAARGGAMLLVDAVTYLGAAPIDATVNGLDFVLAGTQKALALPPGLGLYAVSEAMLSEAAKSTDRGFFLDLLRITEAHAEARPPMTPTISLHRALLRQLETISAGEVELGLTDEPEAVHALSGWERRYRRHARMRDQTAEFLAGRGLAPLGGGPASPSVTCALVEGREVSALLEGVRDRGFELAPGYGDLRGSTIRIGHMGDHSVGSLGHLLRALGAVLDGD